MYEWIRIFSDRKRRLAILSIPLVCLCLFFYQKCGGNFGALLTDARDYRQMLSDYQDKAPEEIVEILSRNGIPPATRGCSLPRESTWQATEPTWSRCRSRPRICRCPACSARTKTALSIRTF